MQDSGAVMIAFGDKARNEAALARRDLGLPLVLLEQNSTGLDDMRASRSVKTGLVSWTPYRDTLYLDADTRVHASVQAGFDMLDAGFDMALAFSSNQGGDAFWHVSDVENRDTLKAVGYDPLQWQCGVMFVRKNERTRKFFTVWHAEWAKYSGQDQAAFVRALHRVPLKIWVLGRPWNGGAIIQHRYGACR